MDTASKLAYLVGHCGSRSAVVMVVAVIVIFSMALAVVALTGGLLAPGSEPIIVAPLRW